MSGPSTIDETSVTDDLLIGGEQGIPLGVEQDQGQPISIHSDNVRVPTPEASATDTFYLSPGQTVVSHPSPHDALPLSQSASRGEAVLFGFNRLQVAGLVIAAFWALMMILLIIYYIYARYRDRREQRQLSIESAAGRGRGRMDGKHGGHFRQGGGGGFDSHQGERGGRYHYEYGEGDQVMGITNIGQPHAVKPISDRGPPRQIMGKAKGYTLPSQRGDIRYGKGTDRGIEQSESAGQRDKMLKSHTVRASDGSTKVQSVTSRSNRSRYPSPGQTLVKAVNSSKASKGPGKEGAPMVEMARKARNAGGKDNGSRHVRRERDREG